MPFARPTLSQLQTQVLQDIAAALEGSDPLLRFSNLNITGIALANLLNLVYGYLDWISQQAVPITSSDEFLAMWAALKNVYQKPATQATGALSFPGTNGTDLPSGTPVQRNDGIGYTTTADATVSGGSVIAPAICNADPTGLTGAFGNCDASTTFTLATAIDGIQSNGTAATDFTGGADIETPDSLMTRMLQAYQNVPQGGDAQDYVTWALAVSGVTRAWCNRNGFGVGTVVVYTMFDEAEASNNGFPQGVNGVATNEARSATKATLDLLAVANSLFEVAPVTALVWSCAPTPNPINFTFTGSSGWSAATQAAVKAAINSVFLQYGAPVTTSIPVIDLSLIESEIAAISGTEGFVMTAPEANIPNVTGQMPTIGTTNFT
ncbi:putative phage protein gp47/JayE [Paraburkholderia eburnea]|uniref:Putative phage protein gp47/JayE n=1 Tax=Paraburkholderia eburnea TaxID=1189126 RepID=A0A2S4MDB9_9BURK|nr:baseplate J/gp47 family protein [Paraburkholderia eburnea]POR52748.1 putative phage protein gp47/JayE [Paraburkholderia eburnea]PRZ23616.1 putative phage protein gp47/JayE [Paraburkholderia eburnea]